MAENRVYKFADVAKSAFEKVMLERDEPENDAAGGEPDDGLVFHGLSATICFRSGPHDVSPFEDGAPVGVHWSWECAGATGFVSVADFGVIGGANLLATTQTRLTYCESNDPA